MHPVNSDRSPWNWLLLIPDRPAAADVPIYNRETPKLFGFPFFFWFQICSRCSRRAVTAFVFVKTKRRD